MSHNGANTEASTDCRLCYVRIGTTDRRSTAAVAADLFGLEPVAVDADQALFRSDSRHHTLALVEPDMDAIGIECPNIDQIAQRLGQAGFPTREATAAECLDRHVRRAIMTSDASGNIIELVARPAYAARRFFPPRDAGVTGLRAAALRSCDIAGDTRFWTEGFGADIADWVGDITYLRIAGPHHQIALYPSSRSGILYHAYGVADLDALMRNFYVLSDRQVDIVHGPGCEPASGDAFLRARVYGGAVFSFVVPNETAAPTPFPRQFDLSADALCGWGSRCETVPELAGATVT